MSALLSRIRRTRERAHHDVPTALWSGKIPHPAQIRHLFEYTSRRERILLRIASVLMLTAAAVGIWQFWTVHLVALPTYGGIYAEGIVGLPKSINPLYAQNNDVDQDLARLVFSSLFTVDESDRIIPGVATGYELSEDKKTYTIHLRNDITFHDGELLNADDVMFTLQAIQDPNYGSSLLPTLSGVAVERIDDYTVSLTLKKPHAPFLTSLTFGILPEHRWVTILPEQAALAELNVKPIGSGPYEFFQLKKDKSGILRSMTLRRYEGYALGKPYIDELEFKFYPDLETSVSALKEHNVDGISYLPKNRKDEIATDDPSIQFDSFRLPQYTAVFFNLSTDILKDRAIRIALSHAVHKQNMIDTALGGEGTPIHTPILPGQIGHNPEVNGYEFNLDTARKILDDAGWNVVNDEASENNGKRVKDGKTLGFTLRTINEPEFVTVAEQLQTAWKEINVTVEMDVVASSDVLNKVVNNRGYDALLFGVILGPDPDPYPFWHSSQVGHPGLNLSVFKNREVDRLLEEARETDDAEQRRLKYLHFQNTLNGEAPAIFLYNPVYTYAHGKQLQGITTTFITRPSDRFRDIMSWYVNTKQRFPSSE